MAGVTVVAEVLTSAGGRVSSGGIDMPVAGGAVAA